jgi:hypothetical protein
MKSRVELEINAPRAKVAELMADPRNNLRWMDEIDRIEPISGELGQPGSVYRLVPRKGTFVFVATVVKRALPTELRLSLQADTVSVSVADTFLEVSHDKTKLMSEEIFTFKGLFGKVTGLLARPSIKRAHRHMESFKRFAEGRR